MAKVPMTISPEYVDVLIGDEDRRRIEENAGFNLTDSQWERARMICCEYVQWSAALKLRPDADAVTALISNIQKNSEKLLVALDALETQAEGNKSQVQQVATFEINRQMARIGNIFEIREPLSEIIFGTSRALRDIDKSVGRRTPGPQPDIAFEFLFSETSLLFKEATGRKATAYWDSYRESTVTPFIEFIYSLIEFAPPEFRPASKEALAERFRRYSRKPKKGGGKTSG